MDAFEGKAEYQPLGIGYLISSLRKRFGKNLITFQVVENKIEREIIKFKPSIVGISSLSPNYKLAIEYAKIAKKYGLPVIIGGVHISVLPYSLTKDMDIGVIGEGEETICDLFELFKDEGKFDREKLQRINGIVYRDENNELHITPKREQIKPLDNIPFPARDVFKTNSKTYMFTSRGCPYRCAFCASSRFWDKVRFFSGEYVVSEIEHLIDEYKVHHIDFADDLFIVSKERIPLIIKLLRERNLLGRATFSCTAKSDLINDELVQLLKELGVNVIFLGLESGCDNILNYLKGGTVSVEDHENAIKTIRKYQIEVSGSFIIGSPKESMQDALETLNFIKKNRVETLPIYPLTPFPGTPIWDYAKSKDLVNEEMDWNKLRLPNFSFNSTPAIILSEKLTRQELHSLSRLSWRIHITSRIRSAIKKGFRNPLRILGFLMIRVPRFLIRRIRFRLRTIPRKV